MLQQFNSATVMRLCKHRGFYLLWCHVALLLLLLCYKVLTLGELAGDGPGFALTS